MFFRRSIITASLAAVALSAGVYKPTGCYASAPGSETMYVHPELRGVLIRGHWKQIEPSPGVFDLSRIDSQLSAVKRHGKRWSLAISAGGAGQPDWLVDTLGIPSVKFRFRGQTEYRLAAFWHEKTFERLAILADELGKRYAGDASLVLVYVPQMTVNGIEGHLQGVDMNEMRRIGYSDDAWVSASLGATRAYAKAFPEKALAFEVHEIDRSAEVPIRIMNTIADDASLGGRVGIAVWWLSGNEQYQSSLLAALRVFKGDIYCQMIGRSDQTERYPANGYAGAWKHAKALKARYVEPWEWDFESGKRGANGKWDAELKAFNEFADAINLK